MQTKLQNLIETIRDKHRRDVDASKTTKLNQNCM